MDAALAAVPDLTEEDRRKLHNYFLHTCAPPPVSSLPLSAWFSRLPPWRACRQTQLLPGMEAHSTLSSPLPPYNAPAAGATSWQWPRKCGSKWSSRPGRCRRPRAARRRRARPEGRASAGGGESTLVRLRTVNCKRINTSPADGTPWQLSHPSAARCFPAVTARAWQAMRLCSLAGSAQAWFACKWGAKAHGCKNETQGDVGGVSHRGGREPRSNRGRGACRGMHASSAVYIKTAQTNTHGGTVGPGTPSRHVRGQGLPGGGPLQAPAAPPSRGLLEGPSGGGVPVRPAAGAAVWTAQCFLFSSSTPQMVEPKAKPASMVRALCSLAHLRSRARACGRAAQQAGGRSRERRRMEGVGASGQPAAAVQFCRRRGAPCCRPPAPWCPSCWASRCWGAGPAGGGGRRHAG